MPNIKSIDFAINPKNFPSFVIDWELTFFCNLDCSYCKSHDNESEHPSKEECIKGINFAFEYADLVMSVKKKYERSVTLHLLGGETMVHPDIVELLEYMNNLYNTKYKDRWSLSTCMLTNGVIGQNILKKCLPLVNRWTVSYHTETNDKQKKLRWKAIKTMQESGRLSSVRLMAHSDPEKFQECLDVAEKLKELNIKYEIKVIGSTIVHFHKNNIHDWTYDEPNVHRYNKDQATQILEYWGAKDLTPADMVQTPDNKYVIASAGYPCCSEQLLCVNSDRGKPVRLIPQTEFKDWYCSVNWYFLFIKQSTGMIYHNTACRTRSDSTIGPLGSIHDADKILSEFRTQIETNSVPVIRCPKAICGCGRCAPKALERSDFEKIIKIHLDDSVLKY